MPTVTRTFTVPRRGTGKPDFVQQVKPSRDTIISKAPGQPADSPIESQRKWYALWNGDIDAESVVTVPIYEGGPGWRLYFGGGWVSCDEEVAQSVTIEIQMPGYPFVEIMDFRYNLQGQIGFVEPSIVIVESDESLQFLIYNCDISSHHFSLTVLGMEERE